MNNDFKKVAQLALSLILILTIISCQNGSDPMKASNEKAVNIFTDDFLAQIHTHKDLRHTQWLIENLTTKDKKYLPALFNALSSAKDTSAFPSLSQRIKEDDIEPELFIVGMNALGNICPKDSTIRLIEMLGLDLSELERNATLESIGKTGSSIGFEFLNKEKVSPGVMAGLYRSMLTGNVDISVIEKSIEGIKRKERSTRFWSAHILVRQRNEDLTPFVTDMKIAFDSENDNEVKIALARSFRKSLGEEKSTFLKEKLTTETNPLVLVNLIGSLGETDYANCHKAAINLVSHPNEQVASSAVNFLKKNVQDGLIDDLKTIVAQIKNLTIQGHIYELILDVDPEKSGFSASLFQLFKDSKNTAQKSSLIRNIAANKKNIKWILDILEDEDASVFQGIAHECVLKMNITEQENTDLIDLGIASENVAMICQSAGAIRELENSSHKEKWIQNMNARIEKLTLPREMEALVELRKSIAHLENKDAEKYVPEYNHSINWKTISSLPNRPIIELKTTQGIIKWELYLDKIPAAVSTIVNLVDSGFYNNKNFHRVVPNFVAQGGCPRGDGWGSLDFTLRSEYDSEINYGTGAIGLASAGENTESCQFFMCHSPTPHLDNRYTIIGNVIEGLDVLNKIELGDEIITMKRLN